MSQTLFDKIWDFHHVGTRGDGRELLYIDRHVVHELHAPHAFHELDANKHTVRRRDLTLVVQDHTVPTRSGMPLRSAHIDATKLGAQKHAVSLVDVESPEHGIVHVVSPELGIALPGLTLACPDSHASTVGALGCLAFGCGTTELVHVLSTQVMALTRPRQMRVNFTGRLARGVGAKDLALHLIRTVGVDAGRGHAVEYAGEAIRALDIEARMTLCNMTIEWGGRTCLIAPDEKTIEWVRGRANAPTGAAWDEAVAWWRTLPTDADAKFDREITVDCSQVAPQVTWGTDPSQAIGVDEPVPGGSEERTTAALAYMGIEAGAPLAGVPVDRVFIGSCSNSRLPDLRAAAAVVRDRKVAPGVKAIVVPGSSTVKREAEREGLDRIFVDAGFEWRNAGCSMCAGANGDVGQPGERVVSTTNRNFENRQGRGVRTHLASAEMAAAAALAGYIVDVRDWLPAEDA
ncbi:MAG TPA: 3-isopropylmalate dehydratase large subunit [Ramlibacter sp.]|uniref:3-isopropylmalate dehydratase large subunit n=1 Tax=Ramlibacter sp. TaxID=1917967 RepID=UPI002ED4F3F9